MDISIKISNRELNPAVVNFFQFENETTTLNFTLDSYLYGQVDLRNYTAYAITSINGDIDMTELVKTYDAAEDKLNLTWDVQEYSLRQEGAITYQIVFKEDIKDGENTAVFYSYKGIMINRGSVDADNHITANYPTILKQWIDRINELATEFGTPIHYIMFGEDMPLSERMDGRIYYQYDNVENTYGHFEDHLGNILSEFDKYMTNCITEIPQDIKLELKDGVLTLKAGSKVYVPNEGGGFDEIVVSEDKTATVINNNEYYLVCTNSGSVSWAATNTTASGTSVPSDHNGLFYNTTNNTVRFYTGGVSSGVVFSLPIARVTVANNICTSIDEVFNGFGYIGSTVYALPGVKGYAPNGRYANGKLKNAEFETKYVRMRTFSNTENMGGTCLLFNGDSFARLSDELYVYDEVKNINSDGVYEYVHTHVGSCTLTNGVISNFKVKNQFREVDWNDFNDLINRVLKLENSALRLTGDQTIGEGVKTFTDEIYAPNQLDYSRITNCLTHIPQDIKLELSDGTLTLKAGSKVTFTDNTTFTPANDVTFDGVSFNGPCFIFMKNEGKYLFARAINQCMSGTEIPTTAIGGIYQYFNVNTGESYFWNGSAWIEYSVSFPIGIVTLQSSTPYIKSLDQVFNGFGYIGSTVFALPGVRGRIPNGRNADGGLRNVETTVNKVAVLTFASNVNTPYNGRFLLNSSGGIFARVGGYDPVRNYITASDNKTPLVGCSFAEGCLVEAGVIKIFNSKLPFRAADDQDVPKLNGKNTFNGENTFIGGFHLKAPNASGKEGAEVNWELGETSVLRNGVKQDVYENSMRFFTENSKGETVNPVAIDFEENALSVNNFLRIRSSNAVPSQFISGRIERGSKPTSAEHFYVDFLDKNLKRMGVIGAVNNVDGYYGIYLQGGNEGFIGIFSNGSSATTRAITPTQCALEDTKIATTAFTNRSTFCRFMGVADISSGYVTPHVGFIMARASGNSRSSYVDFNGHRVFDSGWSASYGSPDNIFVPVGKGVTITYGSLSNIKFFYNTTV